MKGFVRTFRYGIETTIELHGEAIEFDRTYMVLDVFRPVLAVGVGVEAHQIGIATCVTIVAGDEFTFVDCDDACPVKHPKMT